MSTIPEEVDRRLVAEKKISQSPSEQEVVARRIDQKAKSFSFDAIPKHNSLPSAEREQLLEELKTFMAEFPKVSLGDDARDWDINTSHGFFYVLEEYGSDRAHEGITFMIALKRADGHYYYLHDSSLVKTFRTEGETWIKLAVSLEENLEKVVVKFEELYNKYLNALSSTERSLSLDIYHLLLAIDEIGDQRNKLLTLLEDTIRFLRSTKGIFKSKLVQEHRERIERELREAGFLHPLG